MDGPWVVRFLIKEDVTQGQSCLNCINDFYYYYKLIAKYIYTEKSHLFSSPGNKLIFLINYKNICLLTSLYLLFSFMSWRPT